MKLGLLILPLLVLLGCESARSDKNQPPSNKNCKSHPFSKSGNAGCFISEGPYLLAVRDRVSGKWNPPAGGNEGQEKAPCTAFRETHEETGLEVAIHDLVYELPENNFFLFQCTPTQSYTGSFSFGPKGLNLQFPLTPEAKTEVLEIAMVNLQKTTAEDWRFPQQYQDLINIMEQVSTAKP